MKGTKHHYHQHMEPQKQAENQAPVNTPAQAESPKTGKMVGVKKFLRSKSFYIPAIVLVVLLVLAGLAYRYKSVFVAATVNGHPISRLSVIKEMEKQGGASTLDMLVNKKLIADEVKAKGVTVSQDEVNQEIKKYEDQFSTNGYTLDDALSAQNMTRADLEGQILIQKQIEKLLGDKVNVTDDEVQQYITDNKITLPEGQEDATKAQIKDELKQQKLSDGASQLLSDLRAKATVKRFVNY